MDQAGRTSAGQIKSEIDNKRADLWSNLQELERKVKSVTDWQQHFRNNPMTVLGIAFGGGVCLAMLAGRRAPRSYSTQPRGGYPSYTGRQEVASSVTKSKALETWDTIKGALVGVAAIRVKEYVEKILPGFGEQYDKAAGSTGRTVSS